MYKLIIYHDDGKVEVAAQGSMRDVEAAIPTVLATIDPSKALWQFKWEPTPVENTEQYVSAQMGCANGN